jgi:pre-rRNA-processing protein TSR3
MSYKPTVIFRHRRENTKKCSLRGLESREDFDFRRWPCKEIPLISNYIYLDLNGPQLSVEDKDYGLLALDATWALAEKMGGQLKPLLSKLQPRSLPKHFKTAYPRKQTACQDPVRGLATVEALYIAYKILGRETDGMLDNYYWKDSFIEMNVWG